MSNGTDREHGELHTDVRWLMKGQERVEAQLAMMAGKLDSIETDIPRRCETHRVPIYDRLGALEKRQVANTTRIATVVGGVAVAVTVLTLVAREAIHWAFAL